MKTILIVDDEPAIRELVSVTLEIGPYRILTAAGGEEALETAYRDQPQLILLDIMMPDGPDGLEVCRQIKSDPALSGTTVVLLTAKGQDIDLEAGFAAGADDYFVKPFSPLELMNKVEDVLGG